MNWVSKRSVFYFMVVSMFLGSVSLAESVGIAGLTSDLPGNRIGLLIGRGPNPFPDYQSSQWQIIPHTVRNSGDGTASCLGSGNPSCPVYWLEPKGFTASGATAMVSASGMLGASIKDGIQVCGHLFLSFFDSQNNLVTTRNVGNVCRIETTTLRLGDRQSLSRSFVVSLTPGASYTMRASVVCNYGKLDFQSGRFHCEAFPVSVVMVFFDPAATGNNPTAPPEAGQPPQQIVVDPPWNVFRPPNRLRFN